MERSVVWSTVTRTKMTLRSEASVTNDETVRQRMDTALVRACCNCEMAVKKHPKKKGRRTILHPKTDRPKAKRAKYHKTKHQKNNVKRPKAERPKKAKASTNLAKIREGNARRAEIVGMECTSARGARDTWSFSYWTTYTAREKKCRTKDVAKAARRTFHYA